MSRKIDYKEGDIIGNFTIIKEVSPYIKPNGTAKAKRDEFVKLNGLNGNAIYEK